jgi:hypothetical protein
MSDWQVGDLAVCIHDEPILCGGRYHMGKGLRVGESFEVLRIYPAACGRCVALALDGRKRGVVSQRFRKIRPDKHEDCEPEFVTLLKRTKVAA